MRDLLRNQKKFEYVLLIEHGNDTQEETYTDKNGNTYTLSDGTEKLTYSDKVEFKASYQPSGLIDFKPYGVNIDDFNLVLTTVKDLPITETSLIYDKEKEYQVVKIIKTLNENSYLLKERNK